MSQTYDFVRYREAAPGVGEIYSMGTTSMEFIEQYRAEGDLILLVDGLPTFEHHYVAIEAQEVRCKLVSPVMLAGYTLGNLPAGTVVVIDGTEYQAEGETSAELSFDMPGIYRVEVRAPAHLPSVFEVVWP